MLRERTTKPEAFRQHVPALDGLRGLCMLGIVGCSMGLAGFGGGFLGVTLLFALLGYVVSSSVMNEFSATRGSFGLVSFWVRRGARLLPSMLVMVLAVAALCVFVSPALFLRVRENIAPAMLMVLNWAKVITGEPYYASVESPVPIDHLWAVSIGVQLCLIWPPILYVAMREGVPRRAVRAGILVLAVVSFVLSAVLFAVNGDPSRSYYGTDTRASSFLLGCWLAVAWPIKRMRRRNSEDLDGFRALLPTVLGPIALVATMIMGVVCRGDSPFLYYGGFVLYTVLALVIIAALVPQRSVFGGVMAVKPLTWLGERSLALYLWHFPLCILFDARGLAGVWWKPFAVIALSLVLAELSFRFVEQPLYRLITDAWYKKGWGGRPVRTRVLAIAPAGTLCLVCLALTAYGIATINPAPAAERQEERRVIHAELKKPLKEGVYDVVFIGDSVSLGAQEQLEKAFPHGKIDVSGSRVASAGISRLEDYIAKGSVGDQVVVSIGSDDELTEGNLRSLLQVVGSDRELWYVNVRSPNAKDVDNNELIDSFVASNENMHLIDWNDASIGHEDWLTDDGVHLSAGGREAFADLVVRSMRYEVPDETNTVYSVTALGDTLALQSIEMLAEAYPGGIVDAADARAPENLAREYASYAAQGVVGDVVLVSVGNEGMLTTGALSAIVDSVGTTKQLWLVNVRGGMWQDTNNEMLRNVASSHNNVQVVDWAGFSQDHEEWFEEDGIHLTSQGMVAWVNLIKGRVIAPDAAPKEGEDAEAKDDAEGDADSSSSDKGSSADRKS